MTDKEKLDKIIEMLTWKGYKFYNHTDIVDFMKDYIDEAEDNKEIVTDVSELLGCDGYEIEREIKAMNKDFDNIYEIAKKNI